MSSSKRASISILFSLRHCSQLAIASTGREKAMFESARGEKRENGGMNHNQRHTKKEKREENKRQTEEGRKKKIVDNLILFEP